MKLITIAVFLEVQENKEIKGVISVKVEDLDSKEGVINQLRLDKENEILKSRKERRGKFNKKRSMEKLKNLDFSWYEDLSEPLLNEKESGYHRKYYSERNKLRKKQTNKRVRQSKGVYSRASYKKECSNIDMYY